MYVATAVLVMYFNYRREQAAVIDAFVWASLAITLVSAIDYFAKLRRLINEPEKAAEAVR
jgi:hypothetical protein